MRRNAILVAIAAFILSGCEGAFPEMLAKHHELWAEREHMKAANRAAAQQARRQEREARIEERVARCNADCQNSRRNLEDVIHSELGLEVDQRVRLGQLQVDGQQLKELMARRDKEYEEANKLFNEIDKQYRDLKRRGMEEEARRYLDAMRQSQNGGDCCCPEQTCAVPPYQPCRPPELPARRPLLPTEIPLMLPVTLEVRMENSRVRESEVRTMPTYIPCDKCGKCGKDPCCCKNCSNGASPPGNNKQNPASHSSSSVNNIPSPENKNATPPNPPPPQTDATASAPPKEIQIGGAGSMLRELLPTAPTFLPSAAPTGDQQPPRPKGISPGAPANNSSEAAQFGFLPIPQAAVLP